MIFSVGDRVKYDGEGPTGTIVSLRDPMATVYWNDDLTMVHNHNALVLISPLGQLAELVRDEEIR
ncbi:MAG: hypothetical protein MN733_00020 [Nitrososphaera sp.]|nr:hypothetical protein [Nitrososphaera sp.]